MKLLYEEEFFCTKTELLNFKLTLTLAKLVMVGVVYLLWSDVFIQFTNFCVIVSFLN